MAGFDLSDVLAAARGIPGAREDSRWGAASCTFPPLAG